MSMEHQPTSVTDTFWAELLTAVRSVASFSTEGFRVSTAFRPSWKKLNTHKDTKNTHSMYR